MVWTTPNVGNDHDFPESFNISFQTTFIWESCCHTQKFPFFPDRQWNSVVWMVWTTPNAGNDHDCPELFCTTWQTTFILETCLSDLLFYDISWFDAFLISVTDRQTEWPKYRRKILTRHDLAVLSTWLNKSVCVCVCVQKKIKVGIEGNVTNKSCQVWSASN